jgi:transglutaminase-like putative cysteine protease
MRRPFLILALLFWGVMIFWLLKRQAWTPIDQTLIASKTEPVSRIEHKGIYFQGQRIGQVVESVMPTASGYQMTEKARFQLKVMGTERKIATDLLLNTSRDFSLEDFRYRLSSPGVDFAATGKRQGQILKVKLHTAGTSRQIDLPLPNSPYLPISLRLFLSRQKLTVGEEYSLPFFDPLTLRTESVRVRVEGPEEVLVDGAAAKATRVSGSFKGIRTTLWVDNQGAVVKEQGPLGFTLERESSKKHGEPSGAASLDLISFVSVVPNQRVSNPLQRTSLKLLLTGFHPEDFKLSSGRQQLEGSILSIKQENLAKIKSYRLPFHNPAFLPYLAATPFMQSDHPRIVSLAKTVLSGETDASKAVARIKDWVYTNIRKEPTVSLPSALEVIVRRRGDCNEHAVLFGALAKAAGIPTRTIVGLVYLNSPLDPSRALDPESQYRTGGAFYYHAWSEVWLGDWVSVDPTLNQFPTDVTHIRFIEGEIDRQMDLLKVLGQVKIELLKE